MRLHSRPWISTDEVERAIEGLGIDSDSPEAWNIRAYWQHELRPPAFPWGKVLGIALCCAAALGVIWCVWALADAAMRAMGLG